VAAPRIILASASPRRARILTELGVAFRVRVTDVVETLREGESGAEAAERLAREKAASAAGREALPVLAADTLVVCDGRALGKPSTSAEAAAMLRALAGRTHEVVTGVCLAANGAVRSGVERTQVAFAPMTAAEVEWYVATGEPMDKAGGYHIDGRGALFVTSVSGSPSNVAGLPIRLLLRLAREAGVDLGLP
jgi:septum formation protein